METIRQPGLISNTWSQMILQLDRKDDLGQSGQSFIFMETKEEVW